MMVGLVPGIIGCIYTVSHLILISASEVGIRKKIFREDKPLSQSYTAKKHNQELIGL